MIAVLKNGVTEEQQASLCKWFEGMGLACHVSKGEFHTIIGLIGDVSRMDVEMLESLSIIERVTRISDPFKKVNRKFHEEPTVVKELLMSAEYIMAGGNENVILCERGIRTYETYTRNTLDLSAVPVLHEYTHLPVIVDPSHSTGYSRYVEPMSVAAAACGADGLIVEVHNDPAHALCDGAQSLRPNSSTR